MWKGRFTGERSDLLKQFGESISFDWRLYKHDIRGSLAYAAALERAGILTPEECAAIQGGLREIEAEVERGDFVFHTDLEDIHMNVEAELTRRIGRPGAKLHTGRSRNDQIAVDLRLYLRDAIAAVRDRIRALQRALVGFAGRHEDLVMPGYTHLQRAQPVYFAHHLLAYVEMLDRDMGRLGDTARRMNVLPLGSGAIAGSTIPIDREFLARELGFDGVTQNSMDAVSDRDFACELLAALAICGMHLSRLSEDVILWASAEFGFIELSDQHTTGSSLMPQKKNPDVAELTRGKTGRLYGNLIALLTVLKGLPMTYNRDLQEDKEPLFDSLDTIDLTLALYAEMLDAARMDPARTAAAVSDPLLLATDLADHLVRKGVPFRDAHGIVGKLVGESARSGVPLNELPAAMYREASEFFDEDVEKLFDIPTALAARKAPGAPSSVNVRSRLEHWRSLLA
ncbi:MAG: argininosuccinate lyase [Terrimicrobiaceae bacterium]|nr:argininosuccinate lyase [Terrimicrobiaceae bacterium]